MPLYSTTTQDTALDALWPTAAPSPLIAGASFEFGLLTGDPRVSGTVDEMPADGTEAGRYWAIFEGAALVDFAPLSGAVTFTGYARVTVANDGTFWEAASGGIKNAVEQTFVGGPPVTATVRFSGSV